MGPTHGPSLELLEATRRDVHRHCVVCGRPGYAGLDMGFQVQADGSITGIFDSDMEFEGYAGLLHGGVVSTVADAAMANCLFAHGIAAVTAELSVRFRHPVMTGKAATARAWITRSSPPLYVLEAEIRQGDGLKATATGKFMARTTSLAWSRPDGRSQQTSVPSPARETLTESESGPVSGQRVRGE